MRPKRIRHIGVLISLLLSNAAAENHTWHVDASVSASGDGTGWESAFQTIQQGIDVASDGDTVIVAEGTYVENIHFHGKNIILRSTDPLDPRVVENTIIDGNQAGSVVTFDGTENETCLLSGFTITNGSVYEGGGIYGGPIKGAPGTIPIIENNIITNNTAERGGGLYGCDGLIRHNIICENEADDEGGGLYACGGTIHNNTITHNSANFGGGLACCGTLIQYNSISGNSAIMGGGLDSCYAIIQYNTISGNSGGNGAGLRACNGIIQSNAIFGNSANKGGGLGYCDGTIRYNRIYENSARLGGGLSHCHGTVRSNLIAGNSAADEGGGLNYCGASLLNNTIVGNSADKYGGGLSLCRETICNCIIWGNTDPEGIPVFGPTTATYSCIEGWDQGGEGNIIDQPRFIDPDGPDNDPGTYEDNNYRLSKSSPCIDVGDNSVLDPPGLDLDWNLRVAFARSSLTVDMGAYEYHSRPFAVTQILLPDGAGLHLIWNSQPNDSYAVSSCTNLLEGEWIEEASSVPSEGARTSWADSIPPASRNFYRIEIK